jgi:hypothetical protein
MVSASDSTESIRNWVCGSTRASLCTSVTPSMPGRLMSISAHVRRLARHLFERLLSEA